MLHAQSPHRREAASTPSPRCTTVKKAVTNRNLQLQAVPRRLGISVGFLRPARIDVTRALTTGAKRLPPLPRRGYSPKAVKLWILQSSARPRTQCFCKYRDNPCCCPMNDVGRDKAGSFLQIQRQSSVVGGFSVAALTLQRKPMVGSVLLTTSSITCPSIMPSRSVIFRILSRCLNPLRGVKTRS
jgi:hypothetical protein